MEALLSTLAFQKVPRAEINRKRERSADDCHSNKLPRLLNDIVSGKVKPSLVPSYTMNGRK